MFTIDVDAGRMLFIMLSGPYTPAALLLVGKRAFGLPNVENLTLNRYKKDFKMLEILELTLYLIAIVHLYEFKKKK